MIEPHPEWVDLNSFLADFGDLYRSRFQSRGLEFQLIAPAPPGVQLWLDSRRMSQVMENLLANALRFTKRGWVAVRVFRDGDTWTFQVEDSGVGIPVDQQTSVFEPFVQKHGQDNRQFGGTGLGLAICRSLVRGLGGQLTLESEPGVGSRFTVVFPNLASRAAPRGSSGAMPSVPSGQSLLVADDEPSTHLLVSGFLRGTSVSIFSARNGLEAVEMWKAYRPRVALLDLKMPGVSGIEAARRIRAFDHGGRTKILAMSAMRPSNAEASEGRSLWSGFLEKPFRREDFLKFLSNHLTFVDESASSP